MSELTPDQHISLLMRAEQQFRLACTVSFNAAWKRQPLDVPIEWTFGKQRTTYQEFSLREDQVECVASQLEFVSTFVMASAIVEAFKDLWVEPSKHSNPDFVAAYQAARLIRNAFAHNMLRPVWDGCRDRKFEIKGVFTLDTTGLDGKVFDWPHYGGHLAIWRLSQWVRVNVLGDMPAPRKEPPRPAIKVVQQGRLMFKRVDEIPADAIEVLGPVRISDGRGGFHCFAAKDDEA
ncbi:MAG: hypothetical protein ACOZAA_07865 [Pseudomonadota bacterium]